MILVLDNYDSFTWNLVHLLRRVAPNFRVTVVRNDELTFEDIVALQPQALVISPGPRRPEHAGVCLPLIAHLASPTGALRPPPGPQPPCIPILGVCLGHQCLAQAFGGRIVPARTLRHGKTSPIHHHGTGLFEGIPCPMEAMRYHSLAVDRECIPTCLEISAWTDDGEIMALRHASLPLFGIQFHPESFLTPWGDHLILNFIRQVRASAPRKKRRSRHPATWTTAPPTNRGLSPLPGRGDAC